MYPGKQCSTLVSLRSAALEIGISVSQFCPNINSDAQPINQNINTTPSRTGEELYLRKIVNRKKWVIAVRAKARPNNTVPLLTTWFILPLAEKCCVLGSLDVSNVQHIVCPLKVCDRSAKCLNCVTTSRFCLFIYLFFKRKICFSGCESTTRYFGRSSGLINCQCLNEEKEIAYSPIS